MCRGVSTRRVSRLAEGLCGHEFSPATISAMVSKLDASLKAFAERRLEEAYPYVLLDAVLRLGQDQNPGCGVHPAWLHHMTAKVRGEPERARCAFPRQCRLPSKVLPTALNGERSRRPAGETGVAEAAIPRIAPTPL